MGSAWREVSESMDVINVGLYGGKSIFGGKETPLEASVIRCDKYKDCSYFANGKCLKVRSFGGGCKFGNVSTFKGYTSRARKYSEFKREWQEHEQYGKLSYPPQKLGLIDGVVVFPYPFARIERKNSGELKVTDPSFGDGLRFIDYDEFTVEFIYQLCTFRPQAMFGGVIDSYQKETVPLFLSHLEEVLPERFKEFTSKYEGFVKRIDYVGRKALLHTIEPSDVHYKSSNYPELNEQWHWDGEFLHYKGGHVSKVNVTGHYEVVEFKIKPNEKSVVKIDSNEQVTKRTVFVD